MMVRSTRTRQLWLALWALWIGFILALAAGDASLGAPLQLIVLHVLPLLIFMPGVARDNLRSVIWLCFVVLGYFVFAVLTIFAQPGNIIAISSMTLVVLLFMVATLYIRFRGRELRAHESELSTSTKDD